jgi:hypothetical protein
MTTTAANLPVARASLTAGRRDRIFFAVLALAIAATVFWGFSATFYLRGASLGPLSPLLIAHGTAFTVWVLTFVAQALFIARDRITLHKRVGIFAICLALLMVILGLSAATVALRLGRAPIPGMDPRSFFAVPFFDIFDFAVLIGAGFWLRRDPETHQRLMLLGMISIIDAAVARIPLPFIAAGGPPVFFGLTDLFLLAAVAYDLVTRRRIHRAYVWGGLFFILSQPLRLVISGTALWKGFANLFL